MPTPPTYDVTIEIYVNAVFYDSTTISLGATDQITVNLSDTACGSVVTVFAYISEIDVQMPATLTAAITAVA